MRIAIIDYGMGNIGSVSKACHHFCAEVYIVTKPKSLDKADKIILPGVGAFGDAMRELNKSGLSKAIKDKIARGIPFLGICVGLQLLFERSEESKGVKGLGVFGGSVKRFVKTLKVPHMGWNEVQIRNTPARLRSGGEYGIRNTILKGIKDNSYVYFCHSYYVEPKDRSIIAATTDYGVKFASVIAKDNIFGIQFHPEKSQAIGLRILENFIKL